MNKDELRNEGHKRLLEGMFFKATKDYKIADETLNRAGDFFKESADLEIEVNKKPNLYAATLAYYLAGHYAKAYTIASKITINTVPEGINDLLHLIFSKNYQQIYDSANLLAKDPSYSDQILAEKLKKGEIMINEAIEKASLLIAYRLVSQILNFIQKGDLSCVEATISGLELLCSIASDPRYMSDPDFIRTLRGLTMVIEEFRDNSLWVQLSSMLAETEGGLVRTYIKACAGREKPFTELWRSQVEAIIPINKGDAQQRPSFLLKAPTSAGKTNIAELAILRFLMDNRNDPNKKCVYIAPFRTLANEIERKLSTNLRALNVKVSELYGGFDINPVDNLNYQETRVLIATPEKVEALFRYVPEFSSQIGLIIIDEGHIIEIGDRGLRFEMLIHRLVRRFGDKGVRIVFISAVMGSTSEIAEWITGSNQPENIVSSNFKPTKTYLGLFLRGEDRNKDKVIQGLSYVSNNSNGGFDKSNAPIQTIAKPLPKCGNKIFSCFDKSTKTVGLTALNLATNHPVLVFAPMPGQCNQIAKSLLEILDYIDNCKTLLPIAEELYKPKPKSQPYNIWQKCIKLAKEETGSESTIVQALQKGFIIHHGEFPTRLRDEIAVLIQSGILRLIIATSTLINGINSPTHTILIHSIYRGYFANQPCAIPTSEFFNLVGRAGRAMHENEGIALIFTEAKDKAKKQKKLDEYVTTLNNQVLRSNLGRFLHSVQDKWCELYPNASVADLCSALAENKINWLPPEDQKMLGLIDAQLLAEFQESDSVIDPSKIQSIFDRSLMKLQFAHKIDTLETSLNLLCARAKYLSEIPIANQKIFYSSGLAVNDCKCLENSQTEIHLRLKSLIDFEKWNDSEKALFLCRLRSDIFVGLSIMRLKDGKTYPNSVDSILMNWMLSKSISEIFTSSIVKGDTKITSQLDVANWIDDLCRYKLPWAINALRAFIPSDTSVEDKTKIDNALTILASSVYYGVPNQDVIKMLWFGLKSREAASWCAQKCSQYSDIKDVYYWFAQLAVDKSWTEDWSGSEDAKDNILRIANDFQQTLSFSNNETFEDK